MKYKITSNTAEDLSGSFKDFNVRLKMCREKQGKSLKEFAKMFGVGTTTIWNWETGRNNMPYDVIWYILIELDMLK